MARTIKHEEREGKRNEILDVAQRFVYTRGYEQMSIQDILDELKISKGAFYHYFDSKQDLLEGLIERLRAQSEREIIPRVRNSKLPALSRLQLMLRESTQWKTAQKEYLLALLGVWYHDNNAIVRQKTTANMTAWITPLITQILADGARDGTMRMASPEAAANVILTLMLGLGDAMAHEILALGMTDEAIARRNAIQKIESLTAAYTRAMEQTLGVKENSLILMNKKMIRAWIT
ncbi:MAG TPA: TetR/AcrR family transcriptional regulator [Thermoflexales bacterium]|nr:TetR/AcrR family transcriptional regulator [Thermoflexales bacterium]HQW35123.1 TetR/AcrR family transcriptional regulator [Thermoflexales bacterium]HQZ21766.1 TetR/AcrR family transcriptional regulator [Thermoflexales bacterium]HQZ98937.1 TetR/AcrR family transcriptional regulator [Thermoflexales bacterium]